MGLTLFASRASADDAGAEARARFDEGVVAYDRGDYEAARAKFLQAHALRRHPDVLFNLGWSCLRAGRRDEAARHFRRYLDEARPAPERRSDAERGLREARADGPAVGTTTTTSAEAPASTSSRSRATGITASALLGVSSHLLNVGLGARGGVSLPSRLYAGGAFVYNVGSSTTATSGGYRADASTSAWYLGPEVGYDLSLGSFVVRPYAGIGAATLSATASGPGATASASHTEIVLWPGAMASYDVAGTAFVLGADFHLLTISGGPASCVFATAGTRF